jgi:hypothetical protein
MDRSVPFNPKGRLIITQLSCPYKITFFVFELCVRTTFSNIDVGRNEGIVTSEALRVLAQHLVALSTTRHTQVLKKLPMHHGAIAIRRGQILRQAVRMT